MGKILDGRAALAMTMHKVIATPKPPHHFSLGDGGAKGKILDGRAALAMTMHKVIAMPKPRHRHDDA